MGKPGPASLAGKPSADRRGIGQGAKPEWAKNRIGQTVHRPAGPEQANGLFVQTNPAFCCPALVTEAMTRRIKQVTGVPVVTVTYDGTSESKNDIILPYLVAAKSQNYL